MGNAGNPPYIDLDKALEREDLANAWLAAHERSFVSLAQALRLTMLMARDETPGYEKAVRRFLLRFIREVHPTPEQIRKVAHALEELPDPPLLPGTEGPEAALADLACQLEERQRELRFAH